MSRISRSIALSERHAHITKGARQLHASGSATCGSASRPLPPEAVDQPGVLLETIQNAPRSGEVCTDPGYPTTGFVVRQYPHFGGLVRASSSCIPTRWSPRRMQSLATPFHHRCSPAPTKSRVRRFPLHAFLSYSGPFMAQVKRLRHCSTSVSYLRDICCGHEATGGTELSLLRP